MLWSPAKPEGGSFSSTISISRSSEVSITIRVPLGEATLESLRERVVIEHGGEQRNVLAEDGLASEHHREDTSF